MHVVLAALFVLVSSAKCTNENEYSEPGKYNFNHPPAVEDFNPIPVTIIYENDAISGKTINQEAGTSPNIEDVITIENKDVITTELPETDIEVKASVTSSKPAQPIKLKSRALKEFQIPVEVIYDNEPVSYRNLQVTAPDTVNKSTEKKLKQTRRRTVQKNTSLENDALNVQKTETNPQRTDIVEHHTHNIESKNTQSKTEDFKPRFHSKESTEQNSQVVDMLTKTYRNRKRDPVVPIIEEANYVFAHNGNFHYNYEGGDGTKAHSEGQLRSFGDKSTGEAVSGGFSYTDKEGNDFSLSYTADENGYRPIGAHLPTPPPIPPAIARALAYLATATSPEPVTKPSVKKHIV